MSWLSKSSFGVAATIFGMSHLSAIAQISSPGNYEKIRQDTEVAVKNKLNPLLAKYCNESCEIVDVEVEVDEAIPSVSHLGFEGVMGEELGANLFVSLVKVQVQVDDRVTFVNRERLKTILLNNLRNFGVATDIIWKPVTIPQIGQSEAMEEQLKSNVRGKIVALIETTIDKYCPETCVLSQVAVDGKLVTADEAQNYSSREVIRDKSGRAILKVDNVDIEIALDDGIEAAIRTRIINIIKAQTRFVRPVNLDVSVTSFPESYSEKSRREEQESKDPYGLEKLRRMLTLFRELAGTKEIITNTVETSESKDLEQSVQTSSSEKIDSLEKTEASRSESASEGGEPIDWVLVSALLLGLFVASGLLYAFRKNADARYMERAAQAGGAGGLGAGGDRKNLTEINVQGADNQIDEKARRELALRMKCDKLRESLIQTFLDAPKVAKETFSRLLVDDGVEDAAKYVHLFGHLVIFELLDDPNLQRSLYELSEFYHKTDFDFDYEEEYKLLQALKTKVTANEIRVMTRKQMNLFEFLHKLDSSQIYNLISEEKPQLQSIVLTQLDTKQRRAVFDFYEGEPKVLLLKELCRAEAIPKEFLTNVAKALHKKVISRPEFDTENLRSSDVLLELLEKSSLTDQRSLMVNLMQTNPEAARGIKLKLVTLEMLPYLKDGHLLEIIMGMDRQELMNFLKGTREHIRGLLLSKAPDELSESWVEDLDNMAGYDEQGYHLGELKVLGRIRALANNGNINLLDINDMIFGTSEEADVSGEGSMGLETSHSMVA